MTVIDGDGRSRSYPSADKIFPIDGLPVAVMHSGSASFAGVPWELLIDAWSKSRIGAELGSMAAYAEEFGHWLLTQEEVASPAEQDDLLRWCFRDCLISLRDRARRQAEDAESTEQEAAELAAATLDEVFDSFVGWLEQQGEYAGLDATAGDRAAARMAKEIEEDLEWVFEGSARTPHVDEIAPRMFSLLVHKTEPFSIDATLAFVGYAGGDYFPSVWSGTYTGVAEGVVRVTGTSTDQIGPDNRVCINPYGLTDAILMFLKGLSPEYREIAHAALDGLEGQLAQDPQRAGSGASALQAAHEELEQNFDELEYDRFVKPMLDVVGALPMAEVVRCAESLVGLASLRQMINGDASVGGPIDVARITRNHGFEWVRWKGNHG